MIGGVQMKRTTILIMMMLFMVTAAMSCKGKEKRLAQAKELLNRRCNKCHFSDRIYEKKYTKEDWEKIVDRMVAKSKENPDREQIEIPHEDAYEILLFLQETSGD
jgi:hypothetical protein